MGGPAVFLDVACPHCTYEGPAELIQVLETEHWREHWTAVCPWCTRGWIVDTLLGQPLTADDVTRISRDGP